MITFDPKSLPEIPLVDEEPVFSEPWEAQAFAMTVNLHQKGAFEWEEWATALSLEIRCGIERSYYQHWLCALEKLVAAKQLASKADLKQRKQEWHAAAAVTPHGEPILLGVSATGRGHPAPSDTR